jgi:hypothetical protein
MTTVHPNKTICLTSLRMRPAEYNTVVHPVVFKYDDVGARSHTPCKKLAIQTSDIFLHGVKYVFDVAVRWVGQRQLAQLGILVERRDGLNNATADDGAVAVEEDFDSLRGDVALRWALLR